MSLFTPVTGIIGGSLIGVSASVLLLTNGDIMGISGILSPTLLHPIKSLSNPKDHWKLVYISAFVLTTNTIVHMFPMADTRLEDAPQDIPKASVLSYILGGFLVGIGTKLGNGCTTGHGICGVSRWSKRSIVAVLTFTGCSIATAAFISPRAPWSSFTGIFRTDQLPVVSHALGSFFAWSIASLAMLRQNKTTTTREGTDNQAEENDIQQRKVFGAAISGIMFAMGLAISGMTKKSKVHDFLDICSFLCQSDGTYDPTLMTVLGSAILVSWLGYQRVARQPLCQPVCGSSWSIPTNTIIDGQLLTGASLFGMGWGLTGLCPGPAVFAAAAGMRAAVLAWIPSFLVGSKVGMYIKSRWNAKPKKV